MNYDLVIVGASFAGLACARQAALAGLSVAVIEKKACSGEKIHTTGVIVKEAFESNAWLQTVPDALLRRISGVRLYAPNLNFVDLTAPNYYFLATDTPALLDWMAQDLQSMNVQFHYEQVFENAQLHRLGTSAIWHIVSSATNSPLRDVSTLTARYLVGADGPQSKVAKALNLSRNQEFLFGQEYEYHTLDLPVDSLHCFIHHELVPGYLGWALKGVGTYQVGLAQRYHAQRKLRVQPFLQHIQSQIQIPEQQPHSIRAGMIPCGGVLKNIACERAILVGDAAGMVSPVTAGGIHTALRHGGQIGKQVAQFLQNHSNKAVDPAELVARSYPNFTVKRMLRWGYDHFQRDWLFNQLLGSRALKRMAEQIYFHQRGA